MFIKEKSLKSIDLQQVLRFIDEFYEDIISGTNGIQGAEPFIILNASIVSPWNNISDVINFDKFKYVWYNYHDNSMTPIKNMF